MTMKKCLRMVLELAERNIIDERLAVGSYELELERARQIEALSKIHVLYEQIFDEAIIT